MSTDGGQTGLDILVIDDDPGVLKTIASYLRARGHRVTEAGRGDEGVSSLERHPADIVITDLKMPGLNGFEVLRTVREAWPEVEVIMVTAYGDIEGAVRAIKEGAFDFFTKPLKVEDLGAALERVVRLQTLRRENKRYQRRLALIDKEEKQRYGMHAIVGDSKAIQQVRTLICQVAETDDTTVLISGETGTGKELVARAIHVESGRSSGPFVPVDCSAISPTLVEAELFGHEKGAFTDARTLRRGHFEQADGGTLFLDEIGDMGMDMQAKLLRTLESRQLRRVGGQREIFVNVRVVSASNRDLPELVSKGEFREDLFYRLNTFTIHIPPLRDRREDILPIAEHYLRYYARRLRKRLTGFAPLATSSLARHDFPGNIRELRNLVERAAIFCQSGVVGHDHLHFDGRWKQVPAPGSSASLPSSVNEMIASLQDDQLDISTMERETILEALRRADGSRERASELLGISRYTLRRRMSRLGLLTPS